MELIRPLLSTSIILLSVCVASAGELNVEITGLKNGRGNVVAFLYSRKFQGKFPRALKENSNELEPGVDRASVKSSEGSVVVTFTSVAAGTYAVSILHDENCTGRAEMNWTGKIPKEGTGLSNNPNIGLFNPPDFEESSFKVSGSETSIKIEAKYYSAYKAQTSDCH
ncbi:MAG: DUF2141 domain-containing protein [Filomicrobium sp.]